MYTHPEAQTCQTMAARRHRSPANLVDRQVGRYHSASSVLLLDVAITIISHKNRSTTKASGIPQETPSTPKPV